MKKNIGIVSLYYKNRNYGGLLQAYALTTYLNNNGFHAEQICIVKQNNKCNQRVGIKEALKELIKKTIQASLCFRLSLRNKAFDKFEVTIPHSQKVYTEKNVNECNDLYDIFITGSDQVWNMSWYQPEYFLAFARSEKIKISFSASMPDASLSSEQEKIIFDHLSDFSKVAVRENSTLIKLQSLNIGVDICQTIDPTMLLDCDEWLNIAEKKQEISDEYVFCYFLSGKKELRDAAKWFANKRKMKIVTLRHLNSINIPDVRFGDVSLYDVSPEELLGLIKNAKYILTDSFHVTVFSNMFRKKYIVFSRAENRNMDSRIINLLHLRNESHRFFVASADNYSQFNNVIDRELNEPLKEYNEMIHDSKEYLLSNLCERGESV